MKQLIHPMAPAAAVALSLPLVFATPATAAAAGSTVTRYDSSLSFVALTAARHGVTVDVVGGAVRITDTSGILAGPGCQTVSATTAACGPASTVTGFNLLMRDAADSLAFASPLTAAVTVDPGGGSDSVAGSSGGDTLLLRDGTADKATCGAGTDLVVADPVDVVAADCERVVRF